MEKYIEMAREYEYSQEWSAEDDTFVARVAEWPSLTAHGPSPELAVAELVKVVGLALEDCEAQCDAHPLPRKRFEESF